VELECCIRGYADKLLDSHFRFRQLLAATTDLISDIARTLKGFFLAPLEMFIDLLCGHREVEELRS
jgi:hypothetical protein